MSKRARFRNTACNGKPWTSCLLFVISSLLLLLPQAKGSEAPKWKSQKTKEQLDPATVQVLSGILDSLDSFTNHRLKDLEKIRLANSNSTVVISPKNVTGALPAFDGERRKSNITDSIRALKDGIMSHRPMKKTFGYKVTVYTSPIDTDGKDGKPMLVTQYVGGDMKPDDQSSDKATRRSGDLDQSANVPREDVVRSGSAPYSVQIDGDDEHSLSGSGETSDSAGLEHERKTEHQAKSEKGHNRGLSEKSKIEKGHDKQSHRQKEGEHHKDSEKEAHREDEHSHDKGGATQQGIREKTEIEYYEREHFLDTDYDKLKAGHDKSSGLKENEKHNDHESHERKKEHNTHGSSDSEHGSNAGEYGSKSAGSKEINPRPSHYSPPYGAHYKGGAGYGSQHGGHDGSEGAKEGHAHGEKLSAESKGKKESNHERDHQSQQKDTAYEDKDKARRKEGYRERGYKITAEREYFLNDAHHDKGQGKHRSGERSRDREGHKHGAKEGERDRGFLKEHKSHDSHDAAYDAKERKYHDGEKHAEGFAKAASSSSAEDNKKQKHIGESPPSVVYLHEGPPNIHEPPIPIYPHPVAYESTGKNPTVVAAYPAPNPYRKHRHVAENRAKTPETWEETDEEPKHGYIGYAGYQRKTTEAPILADIRDQIRMAVKAPPPVYSKPKPKTEAVTFPEEKKVEEEQTSVHQYGTHLTPGGKTPSTVKSQSALRDQLPLRDQSDLQPGYPPLPKLEGQRYRPPKVSYPSGGRQVEANYEQYDYSDIPKTNPQYSEPDYSLDYPQVEEKQIVPGVSLVYQRPRQGTVYSQPEPPRPSTGKVNYSPVVLLTRGPTPNQGLDVWYTRPH